MMTPSPELCLLLFPLPGLGYFIVVYLPLEKLLD